MKKGENYSFRIGEENVNFQGIKMRIIAYRKNNDIDVLFLNGQNEVKNTRYCHFLSGQVRCTSYLVGRLFKNKAGETVEVVEAIDGSHSKVIHHQTREVSIVKNGYLSKYTHGFTFNHSVKTKEELLTISNGVKIKGYDYYVNKDGYVFNKRGKKLTNVEVGNGYMAVDLCENGIKKRMLVHRIVAEAFIPNPENKPEVNHINGVKSDDRLENLEWVTKSENQKHKFDVLGHSLAGDKNTQSKLTWEQVEEIRSATNIQQKELATRYNVSVTTISEIL